MSGSGIVWMDAEVPDFGVSAFDSQPLFPSSVWTSSHGTQYTWTDIWFTNHIFLVIIAAALVIALWLIVTHKPQIVPSKRQWMGEYLYSMIRNGIAREAIGDNYQKYVPWLVALFSFIVINNFYGEFFLTMFPTFSKIGFVWGLAILSWLLYNAVGIKRWGFFHYLKKMTIPPGVPKILLILIIPLEILSNFITRPITLALRLFANLFAGHLVVMVFVTGGAWLLVYSKNAVYHVAGGLSLLISFGILALELLVAFLQAYIFTVLTAQYVASALSEEH